MNTNYSNIINNNQTHFDSRQQHYTNDLAEQYIDEENDNEVENYNHGKTLSIIRNDQDYYAHHLNNITTTTTTTKSTSTTTTTTTTHNSKFNREGSLLIKTSDETRSQIEDSDDEEDFSRPFPKPRDNDTLNRTSLLNLSATNTSANTVSPKQVKATSGSDNWRKLKLKMEKKDGVTGSSPTGGLSTAKAWSNVLKVVKAAPTNTKLFLGIDSNANLANISLSGGAAASSNIRGPVPAVCVVDSVARGGAVAQPSTSTDTKANPSPIYKKMINNWDERTFRVFNNNLIFGGKLKTEKLDNHMFKLTQSNYEDWSDPYFQFKKTGSRIQMSNKISVVNIAMNGVKKIVNVRHELLFVYVLT